MQVAKFSLKRDYVIFSIVISLLLVLLSMVIAGLIYAEHKRQRTHDLTQRLYAMQDRLELSLGGVANFMQFVGEKLLSVPDPKPSNIKHLFTHHFTLDSNMQSFDAWAQLSWVDADGQLTITPSGTLAVNNRNVEDVSSVYVIEKARQEPWVMHIGTIQKRSGYIYLPTVMGVVDAGNVYRGAIITDIPVEKLHRDINDSFGNALEDYEYVILDADRTLILCSAEEQQCQSLESEEGRHTSGRVISNSPHLTTDHVSIHHHEMVLNKEFITVLRYGPGFIWQRFLEAYAPNLLVGVTITFFFLATLYIVRRRIIIPVIEKLEKNLAEETRVRAENERMLAHISQKIPGFLYRHRILDDCITTEFISAGFQELTGHPPERYLGKQALSYTQLIHPDHIDEVMNDIKHGLQENLSFEISYPIITATGEEKWVLNQGSKVVEEENSKGVLFEGLLTDISEIKAAEQKMTSMLKELSLSHAELEQFTYACTHDLKEPLRTIFSYIELYREEQDAEYFNIIQTCTLRMKNMVESILFYAQLGIEPTRRMKEIALNDVVTAATTTLQGAVRASRAQIEVQELPMVKGDSEQLSRVFQNLISNAIKFCHEASPRVAITTTVDSEHVHIMCRDNGIGIPQEFHEKIFRLFERLHSQDVYEGTGLGLALCKKIIERHHGRIWVESSENAGSTFHILLPLGS